MKEYWISNEKYEQMLIMIITEYIIKNEVL